MMTRISRKALIICMAAVLSLFLATDVSWSAANTEKKEPERVQAEKQASPPAGSESRLNRIDFGNAYIIGQTIKSGAVYLLQRKKSEIKSMLKCREDYRTEILEGFSVAGNDAPADQKRKSDRK